MALERKVGEHFARIDSLYTQLDKSEGQEGLRTKTFSDGGVLKINRIITAAQNAYFVSIGNFRCYMSESGLEWVTLPPVEVKLGDQKFVLAPRIMEDVKGDKVRAAGVVIEWLEECIDNNEIKPFATVDIV